MRTPFDDVIENIRKAGYHNHRRDDHSQQVSEGILSDLIASCDVLADDMADGSVGHWVNVKAPGARGRKIDLLVAGFRPDGKPDLAMTRIGIENKSVITAHRNRDARFDDLNETLQVIHRESPEAVLVATAMIGVASKVLNVADRVKPFHDDFETRILPRLSTGDESLWNELDVAVSRNRPDDPMKTLEKLRSLPTRQPGHTHVVGYDSLLLVPVFIDNVNPPYVARRNDLGVDVDREYSMMLAQVCKAYRSRWHP